MSESGDKNDYWRKRGEEPITPISVSFNTKSLGYENWSRKKLQRWTKYQLARHANFDHVVDLGCGYGDYTMALGAEAKKVTACDLAPAFAAEAQRRFDAILHPDAKIHTSDVVEFDDYHDASVVYMGAVLLYLTRDDVRTVLRRVRERLAPGGVACHREWCTVGFGREKTIRTADRYSEHRSAASWIEIFDEAGFELITHRISPYIYGQQMARDGLRAEPLVTALSWLPQALWRLGTLHWTECSATFLYRAK